MSSGETTLSGSSRLRSSNVKYFLSPPSSSSRSITSSRSLSSILTLFTVVMTSFSIARQHVFTQRRELDLFSDKSGKSLLVLFTLGYSQLFSQFLNLLFNLH